MAGAHFLCRSALSQTPLVDERCLRNVRARYEQTIKKHRPATVDTIYLQNAQVAILSGPGVVVVGSLADSQTIVKGDRLVVAAAGEVAKASGAAAAAGATAVTAHIAAPTMVGPIPTEGIVVAVAEEAKTTSGSSADIMMRLLI